MYHCIFHIKWCNPKWGSCELFHGSPARNFFIIDPELTMLIPRCPSNDTDHYHPFPQESSSDRQRRPFTTITTLLMSWICKVYQQSLIDAYSTFVFVVFVIVDVFVVNIIVILSHWTAFAILAIFVVLNTQSSILGLAAIVNCDGSTVMHISTNSISELRQL